MRTWFGLDAAGERKVGGLRIIEKGRFAGGASLRVFVREGESGVKQRRERFVGRDWHHLLF